MLNVSRRIYILAMIAVLWFVIALALANIFHPLLLSLGIPDLIVIDSSAANPIFTPYIPDPHAWQQIVMVLPWLLGGVALLALHYWLWRYVERHDPTMRASLERIVSLDLMTIGFGAVVLIAATMAAAAWLLPIPGPTLRLYDQVVDHQAVPLAYALAFSVPLLAIAFERRRTAQLAPPTQRISWILLALPQIILFGQLIVIGGDALQGVMQAFALPAASCYTGHYLCIGPNIVTSTNTLGQALVTLGGFAASVWLTRRDTGTLIGVLRTAALLAMAVFFAVISLGIWIADYLTFARQLPGFNIPNILAYEYGVWLASLGALLWSVGQARRQLASQHAPWARRSLLIGASVPSMGALMLGLTNLGTIIVASIGGHFFNQQAWNIAFAQLLAALPLLITLPMLVRDWRWPRRAIPPAPIAPTSA